MAAIEVIRGDISSQPAEAVVNAANNQLWMGSGVAGALKRVGGAEIETEAMGKGPIAVGAAVATSAGRLPARYIIHAAVMGQDLATDGGKVAAATASSLALAEELAVASIAFPALGTGVGGYPLGECARTMIGEALAHEARSLERIIFVLFDEGARRIFSEELERRRDS